MSIVEPGSGGASLVARIKGLLFQPSATWDEIDAERATVGGLYMGYVVPLALIAPVCAAIGLAVFGAGIGLGGFGVTLRFTPAWLVTQALLSFLLSLASVYILALVIEGLAHNFSGVKDRIQAFKVAAYAPTAAWVAGVFALLPALGLVGLLGAIYSLFLLYKGLPRLMKVPEARAGSYFGAVVVAAILINLLTFGLVGALMNLSGLDRTMAPAGVSGTANIPGVGPVDLGKLEAASKAAEALASGEGPPATDPERLKAFLPDKVGEFIRTEVSASTGGIGPLQGSGAEGAYVRGDARMTIGVIDVGSAGALASMAGLVDMKSSRETASGYEKIGKVDGRLTQESYDTAERRGEYGVLVSERFVIQAAGSGVTMAELKAAVAAVGIGRLEALAKAN